MIGVLANDTRVPSTRAAATAGMNHPGRTRARHSDRATGHYVDDIVAFAHLTT